MKYYVANLVAWITASAVIVFAIAKSGSIDDSRHEIIHVDGKTSTQAAKLQTAAEPARNDGDSVSAADSETDQEIDGSRDPFAVAYNDSASVLIGKEQYKKAVSYLERAIAKDTLYARAWYNLGLAFHKLKKMGDATKAYQKAIAIRPHYYKPKYNLASLYMSIDANEEALTWFKKAAETRGSGEAAPAHYNIGVLYHRLNNDKEAEKSYLETLRFKPGHIEARYNLALIRMDAGEYKEAGEDFEKVIALGFRKAKVFNNLGVCYSKQEQYEKAVKAYENALSIDSLDAGTYFNYAIASNRAANPDRAIKAYRRALSLDPVYQQAHYNLAILLEGVHQIDSAKSHYRAATVAEPNYTKAYFGLGQLYYDQGRYDSAEIAYRKVVELDPENLKALFNLGLACTKQEKHEDAAKVYLELVNQDPANTKGLNNLGAASLKIEQFDSAAAYFTRLIVLTHSAEACYNRAKAFNELRKYEDAKADYREAIKREPTYAKAYHNLAILEEKSNNLTEAVQLLLKAIEYDNDNWKSYWKLGQVYVKLDLLDKARAAYAKAAEANPESEKFNSEYRSLMSNN
ncbi:MAG: tetratricopeptide repeat protein [candidate division Zixibacteria bacterium]|nr:tetratricopeptide repeat protein [candidate division Zixibacteria bacterium]